MYPFSFKSVFKSLLVSHKRTFRCALSFLTLREGKGYWRGKCDLEWLDRR